VKEPILMILMVLALIETIGSFAWLFWIFSSSTSGVPSPEIESASQLAPSMKWVLVTLVALTFVSGYFASAFMG
jgi:hydrogenase-4 component D